MPKRILLIAGGAFAAVIGLLILVAQCEQAGRDPQQTFAFYNSAAKPVSVTFHAQKPDGSYGGWRKNILVQPGDLRFEPIARGKYQITVWNGNVEEKESEPLREIDGIDIALPDGKDQYRPLYLDTTGETTFYVVDATFLYSGSAMSDAIAKAAGAKRDRPAIKAARKGERPFSLPYEELVSPTDKLPKQVAAGAVVYAMVPVASKVTDPDEIWEEIGRSLRSRMP